MDCKDYLARFSEYHDQRAGAAAFREMEAHRVGCPGCRRYSETLESGTEILRAFPALEIPLDFRPRLDHRIYHLEDGDSIARETLGTGATTVSVLAVAILIALSAWSPVVSLRAPTPELPAVVVAEPPTPTFTPASTTPTFSRSLSLFSENEFQDAVWGNSHEVLFEYSPISDRRRSLAAVRTGSQ
jgi:hypothetical protein